MKTLINNTREKIVIWVLLKILSIYKIPDQGSQERLNSKFMTLVRVTNSKMLKELFKPFVESSYKRIEGSWFKWKENNNYYK